MAEGVAPSIPEDSKEELSTAVYYIIGINHKGAEAKTPHESFDIASFWLTV